MIILETCFIDGVKLNDIELELYEEYDDYQIDLEPFNVLANKLNIEEMKI